MIDPNLIYFKFQAESNKTDNALAVDGNKIVPKKGYQTGDDLKKVILAVQEAVTAAKPLDLRVTKIDLKGIEKNLRERVDEFKRNQVAILDSLGYKPTDDKSLESALQTLTAMIAQKQIITEPKPAVVEKAPLPPARAKS